MDTITLERRVIMRNEIRSDSHVKASTHRVFTRITPTDCMVKVSQYEGGLMTRRKIIRIFGWKIMKINIVFLRTDESLTDVNVNRMHKKKSK